MFVISNLRPRYDDRELLLLDVAELSFLKKMISKQNLILKWDEQNVHNITFDGNYILEMLPCCEKCNDTQQYLYSVDMNHLDFSEFAFSGFSIELLVSI
jgi:hypothetical protein